MIIPCDTLCLLIFTSREIISPSSNVCVYRDDGCLAFLHFHFKRLNSRAHTSGPSVDHPTATICHLSLGCIRTVASLPIFALGVSTIILEPFETRGIHPAIVAASTCAPHVTNPSSILYSLFQICRFVIVAGERARHILSTFSSYLE